MQHWVRLVIDEALATTGSPSNRLLKDLGRIVNVIENLDWYRFRTDALEDVADRIVDCSDIDDLTQLLWSAAIELGFQHATVFVLRQGSGAAFSQRVCTSYPLSWANRYQEKAYQSIDPVIARALVDDQAFLFSELPETAPMVKAFWKDAEDHGIGRMGLCQAFDLSGSTRIGVSFSSSRPEADFRDLVQLNGHDAIAIARLMADRFCGLTRKGHNSSCPLTTTELRFLHMLLVADDPVEVLKCVPRLGSTEKLQSAICAKLGVKSALQAISISSANRWFDELPYDITEVSRPRPRVLELADFKAFHRKDEISLQLVSGPEFDKESCGGDIK